MQDRQLKVQKISAQGSSSADWLIHSATQLTKILGPILYVLNLLIVYVV